MKQYSKNKTYKKKNRTYKGKKRTYKKKNRTYKKKSKNNKGQIKSGATTASWGSWLHEKLPSKPEFINKIGDSINFFSKFPELIQNQMTIFLYGIKDIDLIILPLDHENYDNRNDQTRLRTIINKLKHSPKFVKHLQKRDYGLSDIMDSEELWQILQEEVVSKIIDDFMRRSLENSK